MLFAGKPEEQSVIDMRLVTAMITNSRLGHVSLFIGCGKRWCHVTQAELHCFSYLVLEDLLDPRKLLPDLS